MRDSNFSLIEGGNEKIRLGHEKRMQARIISHMGGGEYLLLPAWSMPIGRTAVEGKREKRESLEY